jgi:hypothetical protein
MFGAIIESMHIKFIEERFSVFDFKNETMYSINEAINTAPDSKEFKVGITEWEYYNHPYIHISAFLDIYGNPAVDFIKEGENSSDRFNLQKWYAIEQKDLFETPTRVLKFDAKSSNISPFTIMKDYYGDMFTFMNGEISVRDNKWRTEYIQSKKITFIIHGDFNNDFNDDFLI